MDSIKNLIGINTLTVSEVMQIIDRNGGGIFFLVDCDDKLTCCITDGDIRRFLLAGGKLNEPAVNAATHNFKSARSREEASRLYNEFHLIAIPILDDKGAIIDIYTEKVKHNLRKPRLNIPVCINAGGKGTRLDPFTRVLPKPLIPVGDIPIIEHIMKEYQSYGCDEFHIIVNYKRELMKAYFSESDSNYNITWYDEEQPLGTGGGLSLLRGKLNETFFFSNCDNLLRTNYERILEFHRQNKNIITMICAYKNFPIPYGIVEMGINGKIEKMREKPMMSFLTNTGIYVVEPQVLDEIKDNTFIGFPDIIEQQRTAGKNIAVFPVSDNDWMDMGQISELEKMRVKLYGK